MTNIDSPLAPDAPTSPPKSSVAEVAKTPLPTSPPEAAPSTTSILSKPAKDLSFLLHPQIYHALPPPFISASAPVSPSTPIQELLTQHNYHAAAAFAVTRLTSLPHPLPSEIFSLLYVRYVSLILLNHTDIATQEAKALGDINSPFYRDDSTGTCILQWELRVLVVRLQGRGPGGYYDLGRDARKAYGISESEEEKQVWKERLRELGIYVANALIEEGDLAGAARHVRFLKQKDEPDNNDLWNQRLALLYLRLGDIDAAERLLLLLLVNSSLLPITQGKNNTLKSIFSICAGQYHSAIPPHDTQSPTDTIQTSNLALTRFYTGHVDETIVLLEKLIIEQGRWRREIVFNLATCFELTGERRMKERKEGVVDIVKGKLREKGTWKGCCLSAGDFKL